MRESTAREVEAMLILLVGLMLLAMMFVPLRRLSCAWSPEHE
jgi:hypothetical protein